MTLLVEPRRVNNAPVFWIASHAGRTTTPARSPGDSLLTGHKYGIVSG